MMPTLKSIDHIHVFVANLNAAMTWYKETLGLIPMAELEFWAKDGGPLMISDRGKRVHIALFESAPVKCRSTIALGVGAAEFMAWKHHLGEKFGRKLRHENHAISWSLYFNDPDENPYEITSYEYEELSKMLRAEA